MKKKYTIQLAVALVILAALLIYLGVNFVPRISASSPSDNNRGLAGQQFGPDFRDADWIVRNPSYSIDADGIVRNPLYYDSIMFKVYPRP